MFHSRHHAFFFVLFTFAMSYSFEAISSTNILSYLSWSHHHSRVKIPVVFFFFSTGPGIF
ncbi:unnamed protein product [Staurois parvus]|uniref:Uncharacterized protein n=1 Tax=Staurois parvus TaxID=386267 RepID=A0ABN9H2C8_9NEOB|nr:unnamed protein product [Staurois parvus]